MMRLLPVLALLGASCGSTDFERAVVACDTLETMAHTVGDDEALACFERACDGMLGMIDPNAARALHE